MFRSIFFNIYRNWRPQLCFIETRNNICTKDEIFKNVSEPSKKTDRKITVVGCGQVGMACIFSILLQNITNDLCFIDVNQNKVIGEMLDLRHGSVFLQNAKIVGSTDYKESANSHLCVITAGGQRSTDRLKMADSSLKILQNVVPKILEYSPNVIFLLTTNPCDVLTYATWKMTKLPFHRVIGTGTNIDSARFRYLISQRLGVAPSDCIAYIIGEHGDSSVPCWSSVMIGGVLLKSVNPAFGCLEDKEKWSELRQSVVEAGHTVNKNKGYTSWAIGLSVADICTAIFQNSNRILPVTTLAKDLHGIKDEVFLSLPCMLNMNGIKAVVKQKLTPDEVEALHHSACILLENQKKLKME